MHVAACRPQHAQVSTFRHALPGRMVSAQSLVSDAGATMATMQNQTVTRVSLSNGFSLEARIHDNGIRFFLGELSEDTGEVAVGNGKSIVVAPDIAAILVQTRR